ncbi:MAG: sigma 54-interacting transcriptional regulator [Acidobacteriota bacterium]
MDETTGPSDRLRRPPAAPETPLSAGEDRPDGGGERRTTPSGDPNRLPSPTAASLLMAAVHGVLTQVSTPDMALKTILDQAVLLTAADRGAFIEVGDTGGLEFTVLERYSPRQRRALTGPASRTVLAHVARTGEPLLSDDVLQDPRFMHQESVQSLASASVLSMPVRHQTRTCAIIHLEKSDRRHFESTHLGLMRSLAELAAPALQALRAGREVVRERNRLRDSENRLRAETEENRRALSSAWTFSRFVGRAAVVSDLEERVRKVAATDFPVLLFGESGTGKSILARVIHHSASRRDGPFVTVFCPSLEHGMLEAELFGHRRGAFTNAYEHREGKVASAEGGTLFLDEISALPLALQPKLLRLLQDQTYERVGEARERRADVRFIATTNRDLLAAVKAGQFRRDLHERLNYAHLVIPPLRERREDIGPLLRHALDAHDAGRWVEIAPGAAAELADLDFDWPGNVRQVEQLAARIIMERFERPVEAADMIVLLGVGTLRARSRSAGDGGGGSPAREVGNLHDRLHGAERAILVEALARYPDLTRAQLARTLGISQAALYKKLRDHGLHG